MIVCIMKNNKQVQASKCNEGECAGANCSKRRFTCDDSNRFCIPAC